MNIVNAFNSLPWVAIREALTRHQFPGYLYRIIDDYFSDRVISFNTEEGKNLVSKLITRGASQGSVLGPLLWVLGFNPVLKSAMPDGVGIICYADDTLLIPGGKTWLGTVRLMEAAVAAVG